MNKPSLSESCGHSSLLVRARNGCAYGWLAQLSYFIMILSLVITYI